MLPLISVVVPVYNVEKYLKKCIESIIEQYYDNLEIILVDDGSTDDSGKICDAYCKQDNRIQVIHKKNGGLSDARNVAIDILTGEYVTFVDSDDYISQDYISYLYEIIRKYDADISMCNFKYINEDGICLNKVVDSGSIMQFNAMNALNCMLEGNEINTSAGMKLYKSNLFEQIRYPKGKLYEDIATTYKLFMKSKILVYGDRSLYIYLCRSGSITKRPFSNKMYDSIYNTDEMCKKIKQAYPCLEMACNNRIFAQYVTVYSMLRDTGHDRKQEKKLFYTIKKIKCENLNKKMRVYYLLANVGKIPFDLCVDFENIIQRYRKRIR